MKALRITSLLLLLTLTAYSLPAPPPLAMPQGPATSGERGQAALRRYRWLRDTELPQLLVWLREQGPFTRPMPGLLPDEADAAARADQ